MDVFDYSSHFFHKLASIHDPAAPIQVELHPGIHCDLYRCPHCYGEGQPPLGGRLISVEAIDRALSEIEAYAPTVVVSGITTEPLTYPHSAALIRAIRNRGLTLGLYTKGRRLDAELRAALVQPGAPAYLTVSIDAVSSEDYAKRHGLRSDRRDAVGGTGADYFDLVRENIMRLRRERDELGSETQLRGAFLLFADSANVDTIGRALEVFGNELDLLRFALPQNRNDGAPPGELPEERRALLASLAAAFAGEPRVRILEATDQPTRDSTFRRCRAQRFQVTIDKSGNVFPCPQVAVQQHRQLCYGNIQPDGLLSLLSSEKRLAMFDMDIDSDMGCRICDRKDEALNIAFTRLENAFGALDTQTSSSR